MTFETYKGQTENLISLLIFCISIVSNLYSNFIHIYTHTSSMTSQHTHRLTLSIIIVIKGKKSIAYSSLVSVQIPRTIYDCRGQEQKEIKETKYLIRSQGIDLIKFHTHTTTFSSPYSLLILFHESTL